MAKDDNDALAELDKSFQLLSGKIEAGVEYEHRKIQDRLWKETDPEGYKNDMEHMCKAMFGENWRAEYEAMLKEEFPEEFEE